MQLTLCVILSICLPGADPAPPVGTDTDDAKKIQGTWVVSPVSLDGVTLDEAAREEALKALKGMRFTFREDKLTITGQTGARPSQKAREESDGFRLDPTKKPKQIDIGDNIRGIYELDGDTLKLCLGIRGKENGRPDQFGFDKKKPTVVYYVLKRERR